MKNNTKRFMALALAGTMMAGCFTGCGNANKPVESSQSSESSTAQSQSVENSVSSEAVSEHPITTDPITISIFTSRLTTATTDADSLWYFDYLEWWMNQQGYNITIEVQQAVGDELEQQKSIMLGTNNLPDIMWGIVLGDSDSVIYGDQEGMVLDWTPYLNEETMPNLMKLLDKNPESMDSMVTPGGGVYGLPCFKSRAWGGTTAQYPTRPLLWLNESWLKECGLEMPGNVDDFLDVLRAFKDMKLENGGEVTPLLSNPGVLENYLWTCLGYYGNGYDKYGFSTLIKNDEVQVPVYTEDYRTFIELMNTMYTEGLISEDYFTMNRDTMRGLTKTGVAGAVSDYTLLNVPNYKDWTFAKPFPIGNTEEVVAHVDSSWYMNKIWVSNEVEYPEVIAYMLDYVFSEEGSSLYHYGPAKGKDPLGKLSGWYWSEEEQRFVSDDAIDPDTKAHADLSTWAGNYVMPLLNTVSDVYVNEYMYEMSGLDSKIEYKYIKDAISGQEIELQVGKKYDSDAEEDYRFNKVREAWDGHVTTISLPVVYRSADDLATMTDLQTSLKEYIVSQSAEFITGDRPLDEIEDFQAELKTMGIEDWIEAATKDFEAFEEKLKSY